MYNYSNDFLTVSKSLSFTEDEIAEIYPHIDEILNHDMWKSMERYLHHLDTTAFHSMQVCCKSWRRAKKLKKCDTKSVAIGALLHDFFLYDWKNEKADLYALDIHRKFYSPKLHGFIHPLIALSNAKKYFPHLMNKKVEDIIVKHMWPLTMKPPRYKEAWIVCMTDKSCSLDIIKSPKELPKYLGIKAKKRKQ